MRNSGYTTSQLFTLGRLFSRSVVHEFARLGKSPSFTRILFQSKLLDELESRTPVHKIFDKAYEILRLADHMHEYFYKNTIARRILLGRYSLNTATLLSEFRVANCKADIVIINKISTVYEIKTSFDNLERIGDQIEAYAKLFDRINVVTCPSKISAITEYLPTEIGILILTKGCNLSVVREAQSNTFNIDKKEVFNALHLKEISEILKLNDRDIEVVPNVYKRSSYFKEFMEIPRERISEDMCTVLRRTRSKSHLQSSVRLVPESLLSLYLSHRLTRDNISTLTRALETPLEEVLTGV